MPKAKSLSPKEQQKKKDLLEIRAGIVQKLFEEKDFPYWQEQRKILDNFRNLAGTKPLTSKTARETMVKHFPVPDELKKYYDQAYKGALGNQHSSEEPDKEKNMQVDWLSMLLTIAYRALEAPNNIDNKYLKTLDNISTIFLALHKERITSAANRLKGQDETTSELINRLQTLVIQSLALKKQIPVPQYLQTLYARKTIKNKVTEREIRFLEDSLHYLPQMPKEEKAKTEENLKELRAYYEAINKPYTPLYNPAAEAYATFWNNNLVPYHDAQVTTSRNRVAQKQDSDNSLTLTHKLECMGRNNELFSFLKEKNKNELYSILTNLLQEQYCHYDGELNLSDAASRLVFKYYPIENIQEAREKIDPFYARLLKAVQRKSEKNEICQIIAAFFRQDYAAYDKKIRDDAAKNISLIKGDILLSSGLHFTNLALSPRCIEACKKLIELKYDGDEKNFRFGTGIRKITLSRILDGKYVKAATLAGILSHLFDTIQQPDDLKQFVMQPKENTNNSPSESPLPVPEKTTSEDNYPDNIDLSQLWTNYYTNNYTER